MKQLLPLIILLFPVLLSAQGIKGTISDKNGQPVAYANIYVPSLKTGTTSNIEGFFELKLPSGDFDVIFQYIGYQSATKQFHVGTEMENTHVTLQYQDVHLKEIKVLASGEDPAYYVMRHAIAMAPYYSKQVAEYDCSLYLKGSGVVYKIPGLFKKKMEKEGIKKDKPFVMESYNKIHFELPDKLEQQVVAMRSSGTDNNTNPMQMITTNLYNVSDYGIVSPVDRLALKTYRFELVGVFEDQGRLINKVKVIPKDNGKGVFEGIINIVEGYWNIHSADLDFNMPITKVSMRQIYSLMDDNTWMATSLDFKMDMSALGFGMKYDYVASLSEYDVHLNEKLDHSFLGKIEEQQESEAALLDSLQEPQSMVEVTPKEPSKNQGKIAELLNKEDLSTRDMYKLERLMEKESKRSLPPEPLEIVNPVKVSDKAVKNDSAYWSAIRPIPLTEPEAVEFGKKDSLIAVQSTDAYKDSIHDVRQKFKMSDIVSGRSYHYGADSLRTQSTLNVSGIINLRGLSFNTVDGWKYTLPFSYQLNDTLGHQLSANSSVAYAFSRKTMYADGSLRYRLNGAKQQWLELKGGRTLEDFKGDAGINSMENGLYTLLFEENFQKFYEKRFVDFSGRTEIANGFMLSAGVQWINRSQVSNHSWFKEINFENKSYTPNIPVVDGLEPWQLDNHKAFLVEGGLSFTPRQHYRVRKHVKYPAGSDYPTFSLNYTKGVKNALNSQVDFDLLTLGIKQKAEIGFDDYLSYTVNAGKYLNDGALYAADYTFFSSNDKFLTFSNPDTQFTLPGYYELFSNDRYLEAHATLDMDKIVLKRLPLLKGTLIREKIRMHYLTSESVKNYMELSYGLHDVFLLFDVDFNMGFRDFEKPQFGFRISMNLQ